MKSFRGGPGIVVPQRECYFTKNTKKKRFFCLTTASDRLGFRNIYSLLVFLKINAAWTGCIKPKKNPSMTSDLAVIFGLLFACFGFGLLLAACKISHFIY